jgi:tetratricopeptide (TPR) repeat protein
MSGLLPLVLLASFEAFAQSPAIPTPWTAPAGGPGVATAAAPLESLPAPIRAIDRLRRDGQLEPALRDVKTWLIDHPEDTAARFMEGLVLADLGRIDEAISAYAALAAAHPELDQALNNLAVLHARNGALDRAREALERALQANPRSAIALGNLAQLHLRLALDATERLAALDPLDRATRSRLVQLRDLLGLPPRQPSLSPPAKERTP